jgi:hypothetical protein
VSLKIPTYVEKSSNPHPEIHHHVEPIILTLRSQGSPTNVRRVDISDALPGLTDAERKNIREKASSDAIYLLSLQSQPTTSPPSPTSSSLGNISRESSEPLLNAASKDP